MYAHKKGLWLTAALLLAPSAAFAAPTQCTYSWQSALRIGSTGPAVSALQKFLLVSPTGYYGKQTAAAVSAFQISHAISQTGTVGPLTRSALNAACKMPVIVAAPAPTIVAAPFTISPAVQPPQTLAPAGALYVPFTSFTLTAGDADVDVTKLIAARIGPAQDQAFDYVSLLDESDSEVTYGYLQADHTVLFRDSFTVPAHETHAFTIAGNMKSDLTDYDGQVAGFSVTTLEASSPLSGSLPLRGTLQAINASLPIGSATLMRSGLDPASNTTRVIADTPVTFSAIRVSAGSLEDVRLTGMTWRQSGSVSDRDLGNVQIVAGDMSVPATVDGRDYSADFPGGILIPKGTSLDISIRGSLLPYAAQRTVQFDITYSTDIVLRGTTYGYGIAPYPENNTDVAGAQSAFLTTDGTTDGDPLTPFYAGSTVNVTSGTAVYIGL